MRPPLLRHLLSQDRARRLSAATRMIPSGIALDATRWHLPLSVHWHGVAPDDSDMAWPGMLQRYPMLAALCVTPDLEEQNSGRTQLLVIRHTRHDTVPAVLHAMSVGQLVVAPDQGPGSALVSDGYNGFHYRSGNPDSLALTLFTLAWLPTPALVTVMARARTDSPHRLSPTFPALPDHGAPT